MAQITINIQTLDWTMGETVGLHLMLKKGSKVRIAWGDGKVQVVTGKQKPASEKLAWVEAGHAYPEKGMYYTITICSEEEDAIIGFDGCGMFEVKTLDVILTECPNLRILGYSGYGEEKLDVSKNPLLEFIGEDRRGCQRAGYLLHPPAAPHFPHPAAPHRQGDRLPRDKKREVGFLCQSTLGGVAY